MENPSLPEWKHEEITGPLIETLFRVYRTLEYGFLERVYLNAMRIEGRKAGLDIVQDVEIRVHYEGHIVGKYEADLVAGNAVIVELKAARELAPEHEAQILNYRKATPYEVGMLFNFGPKPRCQRFVFDNTRKGSLNWIK